MNKLWLKVIGLHVFVGERDWTVGERDDTMNEG